MKNNGKQKQEISIIKQDKFAEYAGIELLEVEEGWAKSKMEITENHLNGIGTVHGGAIFTLADFTFAAAANSYKTVTVAINANISFMKAARSGTLFAEAEEISTNPKLGTYTITVTDDNSKLIAIFQGMAYRKKDKIDI
ncbi:MULTISPECIES: PaaI family thioesterase [Methanobacterium]|uniref:Phenylacetic acid degradation protein n=1 Tax=Methanobacterium bryantii TaxID=2161 RepID=A0A2A2H859_METBR|nr:MULTISPECIES: PaaI family thioesterase [Methanobacterium]OEC84425.1 phenylacetic acid degradation protein [Methanobacterium sp. A39]PAV05577.1 phenylacetic acid degradation protein [Methanobacterium bryantii]